MESLKNLTSNIPDWQKRLEDLSSQIVLRQIELGALSSPQEIAQAEVRSLRNKGSTESLKPKDDGPLQLQYPPESSLGTPELLVTPTDILNVELPTKILHEDVQMTDSGETLVEKPSTPIKEPRSSNEFHQISPGAVLHKQARDAMLAAHAKKRAQMRKRQRSSSVKSGEGQIPAAYRTRSMIIVYYDSYVQGFFDDLVRFVSASRNMMRKAKMAAKVAQIKRMAEAETPEEEGDGEPSIPSLRYMSTSRRFGGMRNGFGSSSDQTPDVYDKLDRSLETVQSTCEHGAHQFLRDADCNEELKRIQKCMAEVLEMATTESERIEREEPDAAKECLDYGKARTRRPISMRRDLISTTKKDNGKGDNDVIEPAVPASPPTPSATPPTPTEPVSAPVSVPLPPSPGVQGREVDSERTKTASVTATEGTTERGSPYITENPIQVDENMQADDEDMDVVLPKLMYRSTRGMRGPRGPAIHG